MYSLLNKLINNNTIQISQYKNIVNLGKMFFIKKEQNQDNKNFTFRMCNSIYMNYTEEGNIFNNELRKDIELTNLIDKLYPILSHQ